MVNYIQTFSVRESRIVKVVFDYYLNLQERFHPQLNKGAD